MGDGARLSLAFAVAAVLALLTVPLAIAVARRTGFLDAPAGYKAHSGATPYLGGAAVFAAALPVAALAGEHVLAECWPLLAGTLGLAVVGTVDDRVNLSPLLRVVLEVLAAYLLWSQGAAWSFLGSGTADFLLTAFWIVAVVNAFNLMDNMDGAAAATAMASAGCVTVLALIGGDQALAAIGLALCGALAGFLRFNLARPSRVFLGDGGSMAIGFLIAGALMSAPTGGLGGWAGFLTAGLVVAVPAFDTMLVVISRRRRQAPVFSGATDHTTHRLRALLGSPQAVSATVAAAQACVGALAIEAARLGESALIAVACSVLVVAAGSLVLAEGERWTPLSEDS